jgi:N-hydroxyarylamine O-acetyltransferase
MGAHIKVDRYLARIGYAGPLEPTRATLFALHRAHLLAVPFENLDIHAGREIVLEEGRLVEKVVERRRGGFCYELNGAFAALLCALGFDVTLLSARVANAEGGFNAEFDHLTLCVRAEGDWLADVGFGDSFLEPLDLASEVAQERDGRGYRLRRTEDDARVLEREGEDGWRAQYRFTLTPRQMEEFAGMCRYHQTSPDSSFTRSTVCTLAVPGGRITLSGRRLIESIDGRREERELASEEEVGVVLRERFGVVV